MQQHYQVINLHNIIRTQQSKIQQLREQLRIVNEREQIRYGQFVANNKISLDQKDKMIQLLKGQLEKAQKMVANGVTEVAERYDKDREKLDKELIAQKRKCLQLQAKLKRSENDHEVHTQTLTQQLKTQSQSLQKLQQSKTALSLQIQKLNNFYKNSLFQIGKRKETLLWVDKFTQYLESSEMKEKRTLEDVSLFVKNQVNGLKAVLVDLVGEVGRSQGDLGGLRVAVQGEFVRVAAKLREQCHKVLEQNQQFWTQTLKHQKQSQKSQQIKHLLGQLQAQQQAHQLQLEQLRTRIKSSESQKKTIILGFQELRSLTEQKENNYREEIRHLKRNIEELIQSGTQRDREFQREIRVLTEQIQNISDRYYENIQNPARKMTLKVSEDMDKVRAELTKIQTNEHIKQSLQKLQQILQLHGRNYNSNKSHEISQHLLSSNQIMEELLQVCAFRDKERERDNSISKTFTSRGNTFQKEFQDIVEEEYVVLREKFNKSQYEALLAKKHLSKLKEHCENLQKKVQPPIPGKKQQKIPSPSLTQKIVQLQVQNQALKQSIDHLHKQHREQLDQLNRKFHIKSSAEQYQISASRTIKQSIMKINELHRKIQEHLNKQANTFKELKDNVKGLKTIILKPLESLQLLNNCIHDIGRGATQHSHLELAENRNSGVESGRFEGGLTQRSFHSAFAGPEEVKNYKEILQKRSQIQNNTNKLLIDLIKILRESTTKQPKQKPQKKQQQLPQRRPQLRLKNIQKRMRDLQTSKLKSHTQLIESLSRLEQTQQKLQSKLNKSITLKSTLHKFEANLDIKINEIVNKTQIKLDRGEIVMLKDQVIGDLRNKLQESVNQNQGLRREMSILYMEKKM